MKRLISPISLQKGMGVLSPAASSRASRRSVVLPSSVDPRERGGLLSGRPRIKNSGPDRNRIGIHLAGTGPDRILPSQKLGRIRPD